jgi:hypothetical protein
MMYRTTSGFAKYLVCATGISVCVPLFAMAWFSKQPTLRQTELTPTELRQLVIRSGWSSDDASLMLFEVSNQNSGPVFCVGAKILNSKMAESAYKRLSLGSTYLPTQCEKPQFGVLKREK